MIASRLLDAVRDMISDPQVNVAKRQAPLSNPPQVSDFPYVVHWYTPFTGISGGGHDAPTLADRVDADAGTLRITFAALSDEQMGLIRDRVLPELNRATPEVEGYELHRLRISAVDEGNDPTITLEGGRNPLYEIYEAPIMATRNTNGDLNG